MGATYHVPFPVIVSLPRGLFTAAY
jgi:hypothetical protein